ITTVGVATLAWSNPQPSFADVTAVAGSDANLTLTSYKFNGFVKGATVLFQGKSYKTTFIDGNTLQVTIPASQIPVPTGIPFSVPITVVNPDPSFGPGVAKLFVNNPVPAATRILGSLVGQEPDFSETGSPYSLAVQPVTGSQTFSIIGTGFLKGATTVSGFS